MSYTMTVDMPEGATAYVKRRGELFQRELDAVVLAFITTRMELEGSDPADVSEEGSASSVESGLDLFNRLRENAPLMEDEELNVFDRVRDYGREVALS